MGDSPFLLFFKKKMHNVKGIFFPREFFFFMGWGGGEKKKRPKINKKGGYFLGIPGIFLKVFYCGNLVLNKKKKI